MSGGSPSFAAWSRYSTAKLYFEDEPRRDQRPRDGTRRIPQLARFIFSTNGRRSDDLFVLTVELPAYWRRSPTLLPSPQAPASPRAGSGQPAFDTPRRTASIPLQVSLTAFSGYAIVAVERRTANSAPMQQEEHTLRALALKRRFGGNGTAFDGDLSVGFCCLRSQKDYN
jgi:hypothetical protein